MIRNLLVLLTLFVATGMAAAQESPYTGLEARQIKALSADRIAALLAGEGAGYALAAELNGYPGPRHVLDLADSLALSPDQRARVTQIFQGMQAAARDLGRLIVAGEAALDTSFARGTIDTVRLRESLAELARLEGELRRIHLGAHLDVTRHLSPLQVREYARLRGYGGPGGHRHDPVGQDRVR